MHKDHHPVCPRALMVKKNQAKQRLVVTLRILMTSNVATFLSSMDFLDLKCAVIVETVSPVPKLDLSLERIGLMTLSSHLG